MERCCAGGRQLYQNQHSEQAEALIVEQFIPKQENITESSQGNRPADVPGQPLPEHQHKGNGRDDQQRQIQNQGRGQFYLFWNRSINRINYPYKPRISPRIKQNTYC